MSAVRFSFDVQKPIAWVGEDKSDRLVISDVTRFGLQRRVVARKDALMDVDMWLSAIQSEARGNQVYWWQVYVDGFYFLWMVWKEQT